MRRRDCLDNTTRSASPSTSQRRLQRTHAPPAPFESTGHRSAGTRRAHSRIKAGGGSRLAWRRERTRQWVEHGLRARRVLFRAPRNHSPGAASIPRLAGLGRGDDCRTGAEDGRGVQPFAPPASNGSSTAERACSHLQDGCRPFLRRAPAAICACGIGVLVSGCAAVEGRRMPDELEEVCRRVFITTKAGAVTRRGLA
jgi:hypothetical protein